jgi:L-amino acid N-acyltransferase YncA/predicted GIY-YIG superfamily endonuclease
MSEIKEELSFAYMVRCAGGSLYTGWTNDPAARLYAHKTGVGARYTRGFRPEGFAYLEQLPDKSAGLRREAALKKLAKPEKEALCAAWAERARPRLSLASAADAAELSTLYNWYVENSLAVAQEKPLAPGEARAWAAVRIAAAPLILARDGAGRLQGYACARPAPGPAACAWDYETAVCCAPWAKSCGVGAALYPPLLEALRRMGVHSAVAVLTDPNPESEAFHKKCGFVCAGRLPHAAYKAGHWLGFSLWRCALKSGRAAPAPVRPLAPEQAAALLAEYQPGAGK